jgi:nitrous oxide reductase accessory protein NosL
MRIPLHVLALVVVLAAGCSRSGPDVRDAHGPAPAGKGLDEDGKMQVSAGDRCPVCGMQVKKHPKFASALELQDGRTFYFCGTGCLIRTWLHPELFVRVEKPELKRAMVRDYFEGRPLSALEAYWVAGSDIVGPMGPALVPLRSEQDVETFRERHGGKTVFRLGDLDDATFRAITGKSAVPRKR